MPERCPDNTVPRPSTGNYSALPVNWDEQYAVSFRIGKRTELRKEALGLFPRQYAFVN